MSLNLRWTRYPLVHDRSLLMKLTNQIIVALNTIAGLETVVLAKTTGSIPLMIRL
jgi:hypothetical protein